MKSSVLAMTLLLCSASGARSGEAVDFEAVTLNGDSLRLSDFRGRVVIVDFWATWCPPCREQLPLLAALEKQVEDVVVLSVCVDRHRDKIEKFAQRVDLPERVLLDPSGAIAELYEVQAMPWTVLIDPLGRVVWQQSALPEAMEQSLVEEVRNLQAE